MAARLAPLALALLVVVAWPAPAEGHEPRLVTSDGRPLRGPYQSWVHRSLMPKVPGPVTVYFSGCPGNRRFDGCVNKRRPSVIHLRPRAGRLLFYHELGHLFDYRLLTSADRLTFRRLTGAAPPAARSWRGGSNPLSERFAEAYALCSRYRTVKRPIVRRASHFRYAASARTHRSVCRLIKRVGERRPAPPPTQPRRTASPPQAKPSRRRPFLQRLVFPRSGRNDP